MTPQETIRRLKDHFRIHDDGRPTPYLDEAVQMAIATLEKQIPKKPYLQNEGLLGVKMWHCPLCKKEVISDWNRDLANDYCHCCGQKIDWS